MATNFEGYLLAVRNTSGTYDEFPEQYIQYESWKSTPNQREEIKAYRDDNTRNLTRVTAKGKKTVISFTLRELHLAEKIAVQTFFTSRETNATERKVNIKYWNDEDNDYKTGDFYRSNMEFTIKRIDRPNKDIIYNSINVDLVEY